MSFDNANLPICKTGFLKSTYDNKFLECRITIVPNSEFCVILSHPYASLGGTFDDHVIVALEDYFVSHKFSTIALNSRGAGQSQGSTTYTGQAEAEDLKTLVKAITGDANHFVNPEVVKIIPNFNKVILLGYSYGAILTGSVVQAEFSKENTELKFYTILISYPIGVRWMLTLWNGKNFHQSLKNLLSPEQNQPCLILYSFKDQFTSAESYDSWLEGIEEELDLHRSTNFRVVYSEGADHFWRGHETFILDQVNEWLIDLGIFPAETPIMIRDPFGLEPIENNPSVSRSSTFKSKQPPVAIIKPEEN